MKNMSCMNCESVNLCRFIDLGDQPNGNNFPTEQEIDTEISFPFTMMVCTDCWQVQIEEFPAPEFMFSNHPYITGVNMPVIDHFRKMADRTIEKFELPPHSLVLDIGCNDGTLLRVFQEREMRGLGIDPGARTGRLCREQGSTVCETFWNSEIADAVRRLNLRPDLITATAVFYHIQDIHDFVLGLKTVMNDNTVFMAQCVNLQDVIEKNQFDHFYHEHTMIHGVGPLDSLFKRHGLRALDVEYYDVHGGSFVMYVGLETCKYATQPTIAAAIRRERDSGLQDFATYDAFRQRVEQNRADLMELLKRLKSEGSTVFALGAPLKGSTLLNYCGIGPELVECATEVNEFKIGKLTPGTHIPIVDERSVIRQPDYYLLLSWNFLDFFVEKYDEFLRAGGKFIVPHPTARVVGHGDIRRVAA